MNFRSYIYDDTLIYATGIAIHVSLLIFSRTLFQNVVAGAVQNAVISPVICFYWGATAIYCPVGHL